MSLRMACQVPGCRRTRGQRKGEPPLTPTTEWICGDHWRMVPRELRRLLFTARRRRRQRLHALAWRRAKRAAVERAAGI